MNIKRLGFIIFVSFIFAICIYLLIGKITFFKIKHVQIESKMEFLDKKKIQKALSNDVSGNFFTVSLKSMQEKLQALPFVEEIKIVRIWPNTIKIRISEIKSIAKVKLNQNHLFVLANNCGFVNISNNKYNDLENLASIDLHNNFLDNTQQNKVCQIFKSLNSNISKINSFKDQSLDKKLNLTSINFNSINSVSFVINNSFTVNLGKLNFNNKDIDLKISKLGRYLNKKNNIENIKYVDLRYTNGIAVK
tara:strand:- start:12605 stop:13351 length:747 start_codon:yes stop_codon:yes gene_type:complete